MWRVFIDRILLTIYRRESVEPLKDNMGFKDGTVLLRPFLKSKKMDHMLSELGKGHVLLDASGMLHAALGLCARDVTKQNWLSFDRNIAARLRVWMQSSEDIIPVLVFDGHRCAAKNANEDRKRLRDEASASIVAITELVSELRKEYTAIGMEAEEEKEEGNASSPESDDTDARRAECVQRVSEAAKKLRKAEQRAVGRYAPDAAYRVQRMCADRGIQVVVAAGEAEHTMAALYALSRSDKDPGLNVRAVCGYDSDFFVLNCPVVLYGQGLQGVLNKLDWQAAAVELAQKTDYIFGALDETNSRSFAAAMTKFGIERVVQITALFSDNDYVVYRGIGQGKLGVAWRRMVDSTLTEATLDQFAASLALHFTDGTTFDGQFEWLNEKNIADELVRRAERAAFMYYGQPVLRDGGIVLPVLPDWVKGCCSQLFRKAPMSGNVKPGATLRYELQRPDADADVLQLVLFFNAFTEEDIARWTRGDVDITSVDPTQLLSAPVPVLASVHAVRARQPEDVLNHLSAEDQKVLARRLGVTLGAAGDVERRNLLRTALALHFDSMTDGVIETRTSFKQNYVAEVNKAKLQTSDAARQALAAGIMVDLTQCALELKDCVVCPLEALNVWEMMLDDIPCVQNSRRDAEAGKRRVLVDKVAVDKKCLTRGFIEARVQSSTGLHIFYTVVVEVKLEENSSSAANACRKRRIKSIERAICLLAPGLVDKDGNAKRSKSGNLSSKVKTAKICFGGEFCIHIAAAVRNMHKATVASTTDAPCYWRLSVNHRLSKDGDLATSAPFCQILHSVVGEAMDGDVISLMSFNPIPEEYRPAIIKGIGPAGDPEYRRTYLAYRKLRLASTTGATALRTDVITHPAPEGTEFQEDTLSCAVVHGTGAMPPDGPLEENADEDSATQSSRGSDVLVLDHDAAGVPSSLASGANSAEADVEMVHENPTNEGAATPAPGPGAGETDPAPGVHQSHATQSNAGHSTDAQDEPNVKRVKRTRKPDWRDSSRKVSTRQVRDAQQKRWAHNCICGRECTPNSPNATKSGLPVWRYLITKSDNDGMVTETLRCLGLDAAAIGDALQKERIFVNPGHYDEGAFWLTDKGWQLAAPSIELPQHDRKVAVQLDKGKLERSNEKFQGYLDNCMCKNSECTRKLDNTNSVLLWRGQKAGVDKGEFNMLRQGQCQVDNKRLVHFTSIRKLRVDRRHFSDDQLENSDHGLRRRKKQTATWARPPAEVVRASPEDRNVVRIGRTVADGAGLRLGGIGRQELTSLGTAIIELRQRLADAEEACVQLQSEADQRSNERTRQRFMASLQNAAFCRRTTDENNFACLQAKFEYLNARGALDNLQYWLSGATQVKRRSATGRKRILNSFEAYVLYKARLRTGAACVSYLANNMGVSVPTAERVYQTYLRAVTYIMGKHQPWPHEEAMRLNVDPTTRGLLGLEEDVIVAYGDATERAICRPSMLGSSTHSDYKSTNTLKYNAIVIDGGYMCEITQGYSGKTSDNQVHKVDGIPERIAQACGRKYKPALVYDKGLNSTRSFAENGVLLLRPYVKEQGQIAASFEDARYNRVVASCRVVIENCFADWRDQRAVNDVLRIGSITQMDLEATAARVEANTRPRRREAAEA